MSIRDFRRLEDTVGLRADVCIIGSGPAGWTLADELSGKGLSVLVLESGGALESGQDQLDADAEALNETVDTGHPLFNGRRRTLGGSTEAAGWANRTTVFDPIDYEARAWVPSSGWPFGPETVEPFLQRAAVRLGIGAPVLQAPQLPAGASWPLQSTDLSAVTWVFGQGDDRKPTRYAQLFRSRQRETLRVLVHATVTQIVTNAAGTHVEGVEIASPDGRQAHVAAPVVVLAAGGIENPRILLTSNRTTPGGLGNGHGLVGRYLMDHPRDLDMAVTFDPNDADRLRAFFGTFRLDCGGGLRYVTNGLSLSVARQRQDRLLNCAAWYFEDTADDDPIDAVKRLARGKGRWGADTKAVLSNISPLVRATYLRLMGGHVLHHKPRKIGLIVGSEQQPDPESRVTLADRVDRFGLPLARTHWRINEIDRATQAALAKTIRSEFQRLNLPRATLADWVNDGALDRAPLVDGCHPTGTTRMASDPRQGVVDLNCQVHGVAGLYVAGSSVFPTAGHANPTLMIAAMATRLADHLVQTLAAGDRPLQDVATQPRHGPETGRPVQAAGPSWAGTRVAVTGASGFLGERLVERLKDEGAQVTCLLRRPASQRLRDLAVETQVVNLSDETAVRAAMGKADYLFHCAYDWADEDWNRRSMAALIAVAKDLRLKRFVHVSSIVVYDLPPGGSLTEESLETTAPWGYARTKVELEATLTAAMRRDDLQATIIQPTLVYGPRSQPWTIDPLDKLTRGTVILPDRGEGACNAVFVDDVVEAMLLAAQAPGAAGQRFLISGDPVRWCDFYETLARIAGVRGPAYWPRGTIIEKNATMARVIRGFTTPRLLARRVSGLGPAKRAVGAMLNHLPESTRDTVQDQLYGPISRLKGHIHLPGPGDLAFLESQATVDFSKAGRVFGYAPRFDFAAGMAVVADHFRAVKSDG